MRPPNLRHLCLILGLLTLAALPIHPAAPIPTAIDAIPDDELLALASSVSPPRWAVSTLESKDQKGRKIRSVVRLFDGSGQESAQLLLPGVVNRLLFSADGNSLYALAHRPAKRLDGESQLLVADLARDDFRLERVMRLPPASTGLTEWSEEQVWVVAQGRQLRTILMPGHRTGPLFWIPGDNRAVVSIHGTSQMLVGQLDRIALVDLTDSPTRDGMPVRASIPLPSPARTLESHGSEWLLTLENKASFSVELAPLRLQPIEPRRIASLPPTAVHPTPITSVAKRPEARGATTQAPVTEPAPTPAPAPTEPTPKQPREPVSTRTERSRDQPSPAETAPLTAPERIDEPRPTPLPKAPVEREPSRVPAQPPSQPDTTQPLQESPEAKEVVDEITGTPALTETPEAKPAEKAPPTVHPRVQALRNGRKQLEARATPDEPAPPVPTLAPSTQTVLAEPALQQPTTENLIAEKPTRADPPPAEQRYERIDATGREGNLTQDPDRSASRGAVIGPAAGAARFAVYFGPNNILREAARVPINAGAWELPSLAPGRYRVQLNGAGDEVLVVAPKFKLIDVKGAEERAEITFSVERVM